MAEFVTLQSDEDAVVDIVFVGDPIEQSVQDCKERFGHLDWLIEALPEQFTKTRFLYYKYHNHSSRDSPFDLINHAAHGMLSQWAKVEAHSPAKPLTWPFENIVDRSNGSSRPVLFVCHNLGGLVVEEALLLSESDEDLRALSRTTFGMIFLGSPHAGSAQKSVMNLLETPDRSNRKLSTPKTRQIVDIDEQLGRFAPENRTPDRPYTRVYFCQETSSPCPGAKVLHQDCLWSMVPQPWLSEVVERHYVVPKTLPQGITRANIERSIKCLSEEAARSQDDFRRCVQSEQSLLHMYLKEQSSTSCEWLVNLQAYRKWANEAESPLLWLNGQPGAGKSMLCAAIVRSLQERQEQRCVVAFCFFDSCQGQVSSARYILKAITYQLREYMQPVLSERLLRPPIKLGEKLTDPMSLEQFQRNLRPILRCVDTLAQVFFILDGLDDDGGVKKVIMHEILRANRSRENRYIFKCVVSSRFTCDARISPEDLIQIDLSTESGVQQDMLKFAITRLADIFRTSPKQTVTVLSLAKQLCFRAKGTFLWLALAIEDIQRIEFRPNLPQLVNLLPDSIDMFYQRALQRIPSQDVVTAQKVFSWLTVANRPLSLPELMEALTVKADHSQLPGPPPSNVNELSLPDSQAELYRLCGWLVNIDNEGLVRLRHPTLRDYLLLADGSPKYPRHPVLRAHELLAWACLVLLSSVRRVEASSALTNTKPAEQLGRGVNSTLTQYAAANWSVHYRLSETYSRVLAGTLQRCLVITLDYDCQTFSVPSSGRSFQTANTTLRISASYGFISLTQLLLEMGADPKGGSCVLCETPLAIAAGRGHSEAANIFLQGTAQPTSRTGYSAEEMTHFAIARGLTGVVKSLLECGTKADAVEHHSGKTLLHVAAESGQLHLVKLLMGYNANVNATIPTTQETPLHLAAVHGYIHVVMYLVDGQDPSMRELELYDLIVQQPYYQSWTEDLLTNEGKTESSVWEVEARDSAEEHIGRLRTCSTRYSNINLRTSAGRTAIDLAASKGHDSVVRFLIERGADFKSEGSAPCTALQAAVENGHLETVKLLLTAGANTLQNTDGLALILEHASRNGHDDVADVVVWHRFIAEFSAKGSLPVLCLPTKTTNTVVRDAIQKKHHTKFLKIGTRTGLVQRLHKLAERPKD